MLGPVLAMAIGIVVMLVLIIFTKLHAFPSLIISAILIGVLAMSPLVMKLTNNYVDRKIKGKKDVKPLLSFDPAIQTETEKALNESPDQD